MAIMATAGIQKHKFTYLGDCMKKGIVLVLPNETEIPRKNHFDCLAGHHLCQWSCIKVPA